MSITTAFTPHRVSFAGTPKVGGGQSGSPLDLVLNVMDWVTDVFNVPPSKHRLFNAAGLSAGLFIGKSLMDVITGKSDESSLPGVLKPLYGLMAYDEHSRKPEERAKKVVSGLAVATLGGIGAVMGSNVFFAMQNNETEAFAERAGKVAGADSLDAPQSFADLVKQEKGGQMIGLLSADAAVNNLNAGLWRSLAGFGSLWGSTSLFSMFGVYAAPLGLNFMNRAERMGSIGNPVTGPNKSGKPLAPRKKYDLLVTYIENALSKEEPIDAQYAFKLAYDVLATLFEGITMEKAREFVYGLMAAHDEFAERVKTDPSFKERGIKTVKDALKLESTFEVILRSAEIDPVTAQMGIRGLLGKLADGASSKNQKKHDIESAYGRQYQTRASVIDQEAVALKERAAELRAQLEPAMGIEPSPLGR